VPHMVHGDRLLNCPSAACSLLAAQQMWAVLENFIGKEEAHFVCVYIDKKRRQIIYC